MSRKDKAWFVAAILIIAAVGIVEFLCIDRSDVLSELFRFW